MKLKHLIISATLAVMSLASIAHSQDLMGFDRASFGSVVLSRTQAVGTGIQLELSVGSYENEPMSNYKDTVFADIGRSVGRLDALTDKGVFPCTAFIVSKQHILTNYHCSLGLLDDERIGATRIDASQFIAGYTQTGVDEGTKKYTVIPTPVEYSEELDYAVLEVIGNPSKEYGKLKLASLVPNDRAPFWIIGHPQGKGQHISREKCRASTPAISRNTLLHTCDTLPGNSGSPVIDAGLQVVVALHHAGIANDSVNAAILMSKILEKSTVLAAYKPPEQAPKNQPVEPKTAAISACDALYAEAKEAKACYAYSAYVQSCSSHSLAPIAKGYINEFCKPQETVKVAKLPEKTCDDDPSLCSTDQLCGQSLTFDSGKANWRNDNVIYVAEAKRRGLSCGVIEVVATPKKTCSQTAKSCNSTGLCQAATIISGGKYAWNKIYKQSYVTEAKRRGLSCGVIKAAIRPKKTCREDAAICSKAEICAEARFYTNGQYYWETRTIRRQHVTEAKRRGLGCGVIETVAKPNGHCEGSYNASTWDNCFGTHTFSNGGKYVGQFKDGGKHGQGTSTYPDGKKYVGQYKDGLRNGHFKVTYLSGNKYVGQYKDDKRNGQGTYTYADGDKYVGQYKDGKRNGQGTYTFANGNKYVGQFKDGKYNGQGTLTFADGDKYVGQYKDNLRNGYFTVTYADGEKFIGQYKDGKKNGQGFFFWPSGKSDFCTYKNGEDSNCIGTNAYDVAVTLRNYFYDKSTHQRKKIQANLKRRNFYTSSIDGKWGLGTLMALVEFSSKNLGTVDLQSAAASKKLLDAVLR